MNHEDKIEAAKSAISKVFSDTSVSQETTLDSLETLREEIQTYIECIESDIKNNET